MDALDKRKRKGKHKLHEVLLCILLGLLAGRKTVKHSLQWSCQHLGKLRRMMPLVNGIASAPTACRMLQNISIEDVFDLFTEWACSISSPSGTFLSADGKGMRAAAQKICGGKVPYVLNTIDVGNQLCVSLIKVGEKENEKPAFHRMLEGIDISGSLVTADAMATDQYIMSRIVSKGGDFIFQVKKNNPEMYRELFSEMEMLIKEIEKDEVIEEKNVGYREAEKTYSHYQTSEANGGRMEYRDCRVTNDVSLVETAQNKGYTLKTIGTIEQVRIPQLKGTDGEDKTPDKETFLKEGLPGKEKTQSGDGIRDDVLRIGIISTVELNAQEALKFRRRYWSVENSFHLVLDQAFGEDRDRSPKSHYIMGALRRFAYDVARIIQLRDLPGKSIKEICYEFSDRLDLAMKYVFRGIQSFY